MNKMNNLEATNEMTDEFNWNKVFASLTSKFQDHTTKIYKRADKRMAFHI